MAFIGVLPAAGVGSRLWPFRCPKELLPVAFFFDSIKGVVRPMLAAEHAMYAMQEAGIRKCVIVVSDRKPEILRYFGDGSDAGLSLAYVVQPEPLGLAAAIDVAFEWVSHDDVCMALPDTVFSPRGALTAITQKLVATGADLVLGVFPTTEPQQLGPVRIDGNERVIEVFEKPVTTDLYNTWGIAAWSSRFTSFLHNQSAESRKLSIGHTFNAAVKHGFDVRAVYFESGSYVDLGTGAKLAAMVSSSQECRL
jgi:glucose-1-phosphate thymidylyltransferase